MAQRYLYLTSTIHRMTDYKRRTYLKAIGTVPIIGAIAGCMGSGDSATLATHVSDQPGDIGDFDTLMIQINGIRVKPEDEELNRFDADAEVDMTELVGDASELIDEKELDTGNYEFLQLEAEATKATLNDGTSATVNLPGDAPLKFNKQFEIREGETTSFTADFTPIQEGRTGRYVLKPVADEVVVSYEEN